MELCSAWLMLLVRPVLNPALGRPSSQQLFPQDKGNEEHSFVLRQSSAFRPQGLHKKKNFRHSQGCNVGRVL